MALRCLKPLNTGIKKYNFLAFDIETYYDSPSEYKQRNGKIKTIKNQNFLCGSVYVDDEKYIFWNSERMLKFILQKKYRYYWNIATNLYFDITFLLGANIKEFSHKRMLFGQYKKRTFVDSLAYSPFMSVKKQGNIIGIPKFHTPKCFILKPNKIKEKR